MNTKCPNCATAEQIIKALHQQLATTPVGAATRTRPDGTAHAPVLLPPAVAEVLRTGEPTLEMWDAAHDAFIRTGINDVNESQAVLQALRAALAVLREGT